MRNAAKGSNCCSSRWKSYCSIVGSTSTAAIAQHRSPTNDGGGTTDLHNPTMSPHNYTRRGRRQRTRCVWASGLEPEVSASETVSAWNTYGYALPICSIRCAGLGIGISLLVRLSVITYVGSVSRLLGGGRRGGKIVGEPAFSL